ncbi:hypothetical protein FQN55_000126 [Onygenales sp. PD_40]|nr:hypothetical protein FQN55_000126 [Onygenales sp. PD_40]
MNSAVNISRAFVHQFVDHDVGGNDPELHNPSEFAGVIPPPPELFGTLSGTAIHLAGGRPILPTVSECAVHLELLQALYMLRRRVLQSKDLDNSFEIVPHPKTVKQYTYSQGRRTSFQKVKIKDATYVDRRKSKWPAFVDFAVMRFIHWVEIADAELLKGKNEGDDDVNLIVPPLDILMVWHSFLLNPRDFESYCNPRRLHSIRSVLFPWKIIHESIDSQTWSFNLSEKYITKFTTATGLDVDSIEFLTRNMIHPFVRSVVLRLSFRRTNPGPLDPVSKEPFQLSKRTLGFFSKCSKISDKENSIQTIGAAVHRQSEFVDKMEKFLWIHSPGVSGTLRRAIDRYTKYLKLLKLYRGKILVPENDIDLAWHTHQCSAARYQADTIALVGVYVNHNDKLGRGVLRDQRNVTERYFRMRFGQEYHVCLCWECQLTLLEVEKLNQTTVKESDIEVIAKRISSTARSYRNAELWRRACARAQLVDDD